MTILLSVLSVFSVVLIVFSVLQLMYVTVLECKGKVFSPYSLSRIRFSMLYIFLGSTLLILSHFLYK